MANLLRISGRLVVVNHMIGGLLNFFLNIWSISKSPINRIEYIGFLEDFYGIKIVIT